MKSYFFVPGTKLEKIATVIHDSDEIIIDLEDAVKASERVLIVKSLIDFTQSRGHWIRIPLRESFEQQIDFTFLQQLLDMGFKKIILPKLKSEQEVKEIISNCDILNKEIQLILLIEHPLLLLQLENIIIDYKDLIKGIGLGSHDLMAMIGGKHSLKTLEYPRQQLLYKAKAANVEAIDIASMELKDVNLFEEEIKDGFEKGFDAKFLIHPWQLSLFNNFSFFGQEDVEWAKEVLHAFEKTKVKAEFSPVVIRGEIIERPHLKRAEKILKKQPQ